MGRAANHLKNAEGERTFPHLHRQQRRSSGMHSPNYKAKAFDQETSAITMPEKLIRRDRFRKETSRFYDVRDGDVGPQVWDAQTCTGARIRVSQAKMLTLSSIHMANPKIALIGRRANRGGTLATSQQSKNWGDVVLFRLSPKASHRVKPSISPENQGPSATNRRDDLCGERTIAESLADVCIVTAPVSGPPSPGMSPR